MCPRDVLKRSIFGLVLVFLFALPARAERNLVIFDNQSGEHALVKVIGPSQKQVEMPTGMRGTVGVEPGLYYIKVRYGSPGKYRFIRGEAFDVEETPKARTKVTVTLHKVRDGNYRTHAISAEDFASGATATSTRQERADSGAEKSLVTVTSVVGFVDETGVLADQLSMDGQVLNTHLKSLDGLVVRQQDWILFERYVKTNNAYTRCVLLPLKTGDYSAKMGNGSSIRLKDGKAVLGGTAVFSQDPAVNNKVVFHFKDNIYLLLALEADGDRVAFQDGFAQIGAGSTLRFPPSSWVQVLGRSFKAGGIKFTEDSPVFLPGTHEKVRDSERVSDGHRWSEFGQAK